MGKMKRFFLLTVALWAAACGNRTADLSEFVAPIYKPVYATGFKILGAEGRQSTLLKVFNPWQGAEKTEAMLFIARGGEQPPAGFDGRVIEAGIGRIVCMSSTYVAMLDALGQVERVAGVSGRQYIANPAAISLPDVGYDEYMDYERLVAIDPDLVLLYGVTAASGMEPKLRELGIPFAYMGDYLEQSPLGKAEWMIAVAEMIDLREKGEQAFSPIAQRYNALKKLAGQIVDRPTVMLNMPYGSNWFMPSSDSYQVRLIEDAGGQFVYRGTKGNVSVSIDLEEAYLLASQTDFWLNTDTADTRAEFAGQLPKFSDIATVKQGHLYNNTRRMTAGGGNDYWEAGVVMPDVILRDLIAILHPELLDDHELYFYHRLK
jgi:iron complex transport system substrate-binding protein